MGMQSWVIGIMFGMAYQGGKRLISKMPNEEFNALDLNKFGFDQMHSILKQVPQMEAMFAEMRPMVEIMMKELTPLLATLAEATKDFVTEGVVPAAEEVTDDIRKYLLNKKLPLFLAGILLHIPREEWDEAVLKATKANAEREAQKEKESTPSRTVVKTPTGQPSRKQLLEFIRLNEEAVKDSQNKQKLMLQQMSSLFQQQKFICNPKHTLYNTRICDGIKTQIVNLRKKLQVMDRFVQLLTTTIVDQKRRLALAKQ